MIHNTHFHSVFLVCENRAGRAIVTTGARPRAHGNVEIPFRAGQAGQRVTIHHAGQTMTFPAEGHQDDGTGSLTPVI